MSKDIADIITRLSTPKWIDIYKVVVMNSRFCDVKVCSSKKSAIDLAYEEYLNQISDGQYTRRKNFIPAKKNNTGCYSGEWNWRDNRTDFNIEVSIGRMYPSNEVIYNTSISQV